MANPATLKPFQKGRDPRRNLKGRPKGRLGFSQAALQAALDEEVMLHGEKMTAEMAILRKLLDDARKGKTSAANLLFKYAYSKPADHCPNCGFEASKSAIRALADEKNKLRLKQRKKEAKEFLEKWGFEVK